MQFFVFFCGRLEENVYFCTQKKLCKQSNK